MKMSPAGKNILALAVIPIFGFILLGLTFMFAFLVQSGLDLFLRPVIQASEGSAIAWMTPLRHGIFLLIILAISFFVFKTKALNDLLKAIYAVVPMAVVLVTAGIFLYQQPILVYVISSITFVLVMIYLIKTRKPWIYYYSITLVSAVLLIMTLLGLEI